LRYADDIALMWIWRRRNEKIK